MEIPHDPGGNFIVLHKEIIGLGFPGERDATTCGFW